MLKNVEHGNTVIEIKNLIKTWNYYISLATLKANYKIGVFVEKTKILSVQGRVLDCERQIKRDLWKLKRPEGERQWEYERREKAKRREKTESLSWDCETE